MLYYYSWEVWAFDEFGIDSYTGLWLFQFQHYEWNLAMIPGVLYTLAQLITSNHYRELAKNLTNWENHRTERQYQQNLLIKLLVFEFINNFLVLYFLAFIYNDINMLRSTVVTTMTISQVRVWSLDFWKRPIFNFDSSYKNWPNRLIKLTTPLQVVVEFFEGYVPFLMYKRRTKNKKQNFETMGDQMDYESNRDEYVGRSIFKFSSRKVRI